MGKVWWNISKKMINIGEWIRPFKGDVILWWPVSMVTENIMNNGWIHFKCFDWILEEKKTVLKITKSPLKNPCMFLQPHFAIKPHCFKIISLHVLSHKGFTEVLLTNDETISTRLNKIGKNPSLVSTRGNLESDCKQVSLIPPNCC